MRPFKILVCGGRDYNDREKVNQVLNAALTGITERNAERGVVIMHGAARGADSLAKAFVESYGNSSLPFGEIREECYPANWNEYGRQAGPIRNHQMLKDGKPDVVIAFPGGNGTAHMIMIARKAGVPVYEVSG